MISPAAMPETVATDAARIAAILKREWPGRGDVGFRRALQNFANEVRIDQRETDARLAETVSLPAANLIRQVAKR